MEFYTLDFQRQNKLHFSPTWKTMNLQSLLVHKQQVGNYGIADRYVHAERSTALKPDIRFDVSTDFTEIFPTWCGKLAPSVQWFWSYNKRWSWHQYSSNRIIHWVTCSSLCRRSALLSLHDSGIRDWIHITRTREVWRCYAVRISTLQVARMTEITCNIYNVSSRILIHK